MIKNVNSTPRAISTSQISQVFSAFSRWWRRVLHAQKKMASERISQRAQLCFRETVVSHLKLQLVWALTRVRLPYLTVYTSFLMFLVLWRPSLHACHVFFYSFDFLGKETIFEITNSHKLQKENKTEGCYNFYMYSVTLRWEPASISYLFLHHLCWTTDILFVL